jgi:hypothetical protein
VFATTRRSTASAALAAICQRPVAELANTRSRSRAGAPRNLAPVSGQTPLALISGCVTADLASTLITGAVATVAVVANTLMSRRSLAHQRELNKEERSWRAVSELYVDVLAERTIYRKLFGSAERRYELPHDFAEGRDRLSARVAAFASDSVRELHERRQSAAWAVHEAIAELYEADPALPIHSCWKVPSVAALSNVHLEIEDALADRVRQELARTAST